MTASGARRADASGASRRPESSGSSSRPARAGLPSPLSFLFAALRPRTGVRRGLAAALILLALAALAPSGPAQAAPAKVTGVTVTRASSTSLTVRWNAVANACNYLLQWKADGQQYVSVRSLFNGLQDCSGRTTFSTITGLTTGTTYTVRIRAFDATNDRSPWSDEVTATPTLQNVVLTAPVEGEKLRAIWFPFVGAAGYIAELLVGSATTPSETTDLLTGFSHTFANLVPGTSYKVKVTAYDSNGAAIANSAGTSATHVSVSLSELERDVDVRLTDSQDQVIGSSTNGSNDDEQMDVLLWPGSYKLAIEAVDEGRSKFVLELNSRVPAPITQQVIDRSGQVGAGDKSFEVLAVPGAEVVTIGLTGLSADVDIRLFDAEYAEVESSLNPDNENEEITVHLWPGQYALEIDGQGDSDYRLDVARRALELRRLPFEVEGRVGEGDDQSVWFEIHETATVKASLSGLNADVDLKIVGKSGELASSINGGASNEWLEEELPPGEYVLGVYALDAGSDYLLAAGDDPEWTGPDTNDDGSNPEK